MRFQKIINIEKGAMSLVAVEVMLVATAAAVLVGGVARNIPDILTSAKDVQKVANVRQLTTALELYYLDNLSYPLVTAQAGEGFSLMLSEFSQGRYLGSLPTNQEDYSYHDIRGGQGYILRVLLKDKESPHLESDLDGYLEGIDCNDPFYCIKME